MFFMPSMSDSGITHDHYEKNVLSALHWRSHSSLMVARLYHANRIARSGTNQGRGQRQHGGEGQAKTA